ncbi:MAG: tetratricopeptide repeat protein [Amphritea sp.]
MAVTRDAQAEAKVDYTDKSVLLIDSSGNLRATIYYMLRELGVHNIKAITINDRVMPTIAQGDFDVILVGHNASDTVTGIQLMEEARFRGHIKPSAAWICLTSDSSQEAILHAIDSNPDDLITKPFSLEDLKFRLDQIMRRKKSLRPVDLAIESGAIDSALQICEALIDRKHPDYEHLQLVRGKLLLQLKRFDEAQQLLGGIYWEKRDKEAGLYLAQAYCGLDDLLKAEKLLLELIENNPLLIAACDLLAEVYEKLGDLVQAREWLQHATAKAPLGIPRQMELGRVAIQTKELKIAEGAYKKSILQGKHSCYSSAEPYLKLANIRRLEVKGADDGMQEQLNKEIDGLLVSARKQFPTDSESEVKAFLIRSQLAEDLGDSKQKERFLREAKIINRELEKPVNLDRELLVMSGDAVPVLEVAKPEIEEATVTKKQANPEMSDKANRLGIKHYLTGKTGLAIKSFGAAIDFDLNNHAAVLNLAQLFLETARDDKERREGRLKMVARYLGLASRRVLDGEAHDKQQLLTTLSAMDLEELPTGSLGPLLK